MSDDQAVAPRETLVLTSSEAIDLKRYPWVVAVRAYLKGADAGTAHGSGESGYILLELYDREP